MANAFADTAARPLILDLLARRNWFDSGRLGEIEETLQKAKPGTLAEVTLIRAGYISEQEIAGIYGEDLFLPTIQSTLEAGALDKELGNLLPEKLCSDRLICPIAVREDVFDIAFVSPEAMGVVDELQLMTGLLINPIIAPLSVVEAGLDALYRSTRDHKAIGEGTEDFDATEGEEDNDSDNILNLDASPPADANGRIVRMVNQILEQALRNRASDIHLEPFEDGCKFRLRIDGVLHELPPPSKSVFIMIISRFKILAKMDIAEKRIPQDGAIALPHWRQAHRPPGQHRPDGSRREDGDADLGQGGDPARTDRVGPRRTAVQRLDRVDRVAIRAGACDGPDRQRQVDNALFLPQPA